MRSGLVVGVDIGGTKTHLRASRDGIAVEDRVVPTTDWRQRDNGQDAGALFALIAEMSGGPAAIGVGAHGCDTPEECATFEQVLSALTPARVRVVNDAELLGWALGLPQAIGVIAGTGSVAVARTREGSMLIAGGWGWVFGDEGSAPGLVREAIRAVRGALDSGEPDDGLFAVLRRSTGATTVNELSRGLVREGNATAVGLHANAVFEAAAAGSGRAVQVVREGARALVDLVERLVGRGAPSRDVVASGGVMVSQPLLQDLFRQELALRLRDHRLRVLTEPPVCGAVALAASLVDAERPVSSSSR